jgi:hypothetical protein
MRKQLALGSIAIAWAQPFPSRAITLVKAANIKAE